MTVFALISESKNVTKKDLVLLAAVLEVSAKHCATGFGLECPAVVPVDSFDNLENVKNVHPIVFTDKEDASGALGYHYWDVFRAGPSSRVFVPSCSGLNSGYYSVVETASHEVVEAMTDPQVNIWKEFPGNKSLLMAYEVADMTQEHYETTMFGDKWRLSNFVLPAYFENRLVEKVNRERFTASGGKFDFVGTMSRPGEIRPEGYAIVRDASTGKQYPIYGSGFSVRSPEAKRHPWARTFRRGVVLDSSYSTHSQNQTQT